MMKRLEIMLGKKLSRGQRFSQVLMNEAEAYISKIEDPKLRSLAKKVRSIVKSALPGAVESIKMGIPNYSIDERGIACIADYTKHINLYFLQGARLSSERLEGTGKGMRHIKITKAEDIDEAEFSRLLKKAAKI